MSTDIQPGSLQEPSLLGVRDALHVPVVVCQAHTAMPPGMPVGVRGSFTTFEGDPVGVADPFLRETIRAGHLVAVMLLPKSTSNVRHTWEHPGIDAPDTPMPKTVESVESAMAGAMLPAPTARWQQHLRATAKALGCSVGLLEDSVDYMIENGSSVGGYQPDLDTDTVDWKEFWDLYNDTHGTTLRFSEDPFCC